MKGGILALFTLAFLVFAGCQRVEVLAQTRRTKVLGIKVYVNRFLGIKLAPADYYVLEDGRLLDRELYFNRIEGVYYHDHGGKAGYDKYCETEYVPATNTKPVNVRRGTLGMPCPKEKCPEMYDKNTGLPIPPSPVPTP